MARAHTTLLGLGSWLCVLLQGCYSAKPCEPEVCDGRDNDCDGKTDEAFVDAAGRYTLLSHCGACNVVCSDVLPTATETVCLPGADGRHRCTATACAEGERLRDGVCLPQVTALCAACEGDAECTALDPDSRCVEERCGAACGFASGDCPPGFGCHAIAGFDPDDARGQCVPDSGDCSCTRDQIGAQLACTLQSMHGARCAGRQLCTDRGLTACEAAQDEACNGEDDDCDGRVDEGFVDALGRYLSQEHCGACNTPCIAPGPQIVAECTAAQAPMLPPDEPPRCTTRCEDGYFDVDGLAANGCECSVLPPVGPVIGGDNDCDGVIDETPDLIFVAPQGDDASDGQDVSRPVRTLARGSALGVLTGRSVLVAGGVYASPGELLSGVRLLGGYSADFRARDAGRFPSIIERGAQAPGEPVLRCTDVSAATRIDGFTLVGDDAGASGAGSTTVYLDRCTDAVVLSDLTVLAGRGGHGRGGDSSSVRLAGWGLSSLTELSGRDGVQGGDGSAPSAACASVPGGAGGAKTCRRGDSETDVSGGHGGGSECLDLSLLCSNDGGAPCGNAGCTDFSESGVCDIDAMLAAALPGPAAGAGRGENAGRPGTPAYAAPTNRGTCSFCDDNPSLQREGAEGEDGALGAHGAGGLGCGSSTLFDAATGRMGAARGTDGTDGTDGSGGGGATAGGGFSVIGSTTGSCDNRAGGSGGGAGSGGCGAPGAGGGLGGGSSIGIAVRLRPGALSSGPQLDDVRVVTASGGDGGDGGIGALGGTGGVGAHGGDAFFYCARAGARGGDGGPGGAGGGGGGGCGGNSYGIAVLGQPSASYIGRVRGDVSVERAGVPGRAGRGGFSPGEPGRDGLPGAVEDHAFFGAP